MPAIVRTQQHGSPRDMLETLNDVLYDNIRTRLAHRDTSYSAVRRTASWNVLCTDGITEARDAAGKMFALDGVVDAVWEVAARSVEDIRDFVLARARAHLVKQHDDMSVVVVRRQRRGVT